ncbi:DoxX family protein [Fodinibius salsisoli]|uniref:DoxX family protein n=1 Tax=Fodinibius salsisoli TaxID=2820877 RepID=A0ABT3PP30_9BACT|nr:DoxX family protein [Fodinibius salsisoli]MCW9707622.1 DoxX family protein [Fodinibius salsisoli]
MLRTQRQKKLRNIGILILRVGLGIMFMLHGYPKVFGGPEMWTQVGSTLQVIGIDFAPMFFGFMAGITEFFGGLFLMLGLFFTPSLILLIIVMIVAAITHIASGDPFTAYSHSIELAIVFLSLLFIRPGPYSLDKKLEKRRRRY